MVAYIETTSCKRLRRLIITIPDARVTTIADVVYKLSSQIKDNRNDILQAVGFSMEFYPLVTDIDDTSVNTKLFFVEASYSVIDETYYAIGVEINDRIGVNTEYQRMTIPNGLFKTRGSDIGHSRIMQEPYHSNGNHTQTYSHLLEPAT